MEQPNPLLPCVEAQVSRMVAILRAEFTDVHHVRHWIDGGPTNLGNLVELCDHHHRCVHEMGWKMAGDANVELTFESPAGRRSASTPSPGPIAARDGPPG